MHGINIIKKEVKKKLLSTIEKNANLIRLETRNNSRSLPENEKNRKEKHQRERCHKNTDFNEK